MLGKESWMRIHQEVDMFITSITGNKIKKRKLGPTTLVIHERRLGAWTKVLSSYSKFPIRGKTRDIVYTIFDGQVERTRLGTMAKEQKPLRAALQTSPAT